MHQKGELYMVQHLYLCWAAPEVNTAVASSKHAGQSAVK